MKLSVAVAALAAACAALQTADAAPQGWHVKVRVHTVKQQVSEMCSSSDGELECADDLQCVQINDYYGACMKKQPALYEQCGGHSVKGPWKNPCGGDVSANATDSSSSSSIDSTVSDSSTCVFISPYYSQCQDLTKREHYRFKSHEKGAGNKKHHHHKDHHEAEKKVAIYGQCVWIDSTAKCDTGLQCITESAHYGQCRNKVVNLYDQCGGKTWKGPWSAECQQGVCIKRDEWYSQCLGTGTAATTTPSPSPAVTSAPGASPVANRWDQCGGAGFPSARTCVAGSKCVKHNSWYSQCKPDKLPVGELCGQKKQGNDWMHASCESNATCKPSNADGLEYRCKL